MAEDTAEDVVDDVAADDDTVRLSEWMCDLLLWQELELDPGLARWLAAQAFPALPAGDPSKVKVTPWCWRGNGETDLLVQLSWGDDQYDLHVEDKIGAPWSLGNQLQRYIDYVTPRPKAAAMVIGPDWFFGREVEVIDKVGIDSVSFEAIAAEIRRRAGEETNGVAARRQWVAERIESASKQAPLSDWGRPSEVLGAWIAELKVAARSFELEPHLNPVAGDHPVSGRFIPETTALPRWGGYQAKLWYKVRRPGLASHVSIDLQPKPDGADARRLMTEAHAAGYEYDDRPTRSTIVRHFDDRFADVVMDHPVAGQAEAIHAMLGAAVRMRAWWEGFVGS